MAMVEVCSIVGSDCARRLKTKRCRVVRHWSTPPCMLAVLLALLMPTASRPGGELRHPPDQHVVLFPCRVVPLSRGRAYLSVPFLDGSEDGSCVEGVDYNLYAHLTDEQGGVTTTEERSFSSNDLYHGALAIPLAPLPEGTRRQD
jgi:hypothetical protein